MENKVLLILCDGMRPDSIPACGNPYARQFESESASTMAASSVNPPVTLPSHMSIFYSVTPQRHGILTNTYVPQVRPIDGLVEHLDRLGKRCAMFHTWETLRDLNRPETLEVSLCYSGRTIGYGPATQLLMPPTLEYLNRAQPDFAFLYLADPDDIGHHHGWMSQPYLDSVSQSWDFIRQVVENIPDCYSVIVTADHGGHDYTHGELCPEDMTIPLYFRGPDFAPGSQLPSGITLLDLAPTITSLLGVAPNKEWEGSSLI